MRCSRCDAEEYMLTDTHCPNCHYPSPDFRNPEQIEIDTTLTQLRKESIPHCTKPTVVTAVRYLKAPFYENSKND